MSGRTFSSEEDEEKIVKTTYNSIVKTDEKDNFVVFPLDYFIGKDFDFQLEQVAILTLGSWGLENKAQFPDFKAVNEFLKERFKFDQDDDRSNSPL